jgi:hypothetical protein
MEYCRAVGRDPVAISKVRFPLEHWLAAYPEFIRSPGDLAVPKMSATTESLPVKVSVKSNGFGPSCEPFGPAHTWMSATANSLPDSGVRFGSWLCTGY